MNSKSQTYSEKIKNRRQSFVRPCFEWKQFKNIKKSISSVIANKENKRLKKNTLKRIIFNLNSNFIFV